MYLVALAELAELVEASGQPAATWQQQRGLQYNTYNREKCEKHKLFKQLCNRYS
jgi:hypothetical protein